MIPFPDIDTLEPGSAARAADTAAFTLGHAPPPSPRGRPTRPGRALFDDDFDLPQQAAAPAEPEIIEPSFTLAEFEAAREEGFRAGEETARAVAETAGLAADRAVLAVIGEQLEVARREAAEAAADTAGSIATLLLDTLGTLFPALCARFGEAEAQALTRTILPVLHLEPRAAIRLPPALVQPIIATITRADPDLIARIDIVPDATMADGDLRVTWRNGEARRDARALWAEIGDILGQAGWPMPHHAMPQHEMKETADVE